MFPFPNPTYCLRLVQHLFLQPCPHQSLGEQIIHCCDAGSSIDAATSYSSLLKTLIWCTCRPSLSFAKQTLHSFAVCSCINNLALGFPFNPFQVISPGLRPTYYPLIEPILFPGAAPWIFGIYSEKDHIPGSLLIEGRTERERDRDRERDRAGRDKERERESVMCWGL